ncbi:MAG: protein translocase subunit SecD [Ilumatobacteraceae bacterium]|nr:protein translocase subunit SecD [Ilumatobacteraceae bacterium]
MNRRLLASLIGILLVAVVSVGFTVASGDAPSLGLDLQGGASITLQPEGEYDAVALEVAVEIIRSRVDAIGVAEPEIIRQGDTVVVNLPGVKDQQRALDIVGRTGDLHLRPVLQSGSFDPTAGEVETTPTTETSLPTETSVPTEGGPGESRGGRVMVDTTIPTDTTVATDTTIATETTIAAAPADATSADAEAQSELPPGSEVLLGRDGFAYLVGPIAATGLVFENNAQATIQGANWSVVVQLRGGTAGADVWNALTSRCFSRDATCPTAQIAIVLDGEVISAPVVQEAVFSGGEVQITGDFTEQDARDLARVLEFGAVPVKFAVSQVQTVSPTLGSDSLRAAIISGLVGLVLVFLLMLAYYRFVAIIVFGGLAVSIGIQYSIITYLSKTNGLALSLSGIAGIIVSIGIAVDSYIVFFERLKDELASGRTLRNSAQRSFEGAWRTVLAADSVSFLAAAVLWWLTVGSVRGFAFFLGLATLADVMIVWFFTRPAMLLLARSKFMATRSMLGIKPRKGAEVIS